MACVQADEGREKRDGARWKVENVVIECLWGCYCRYRLSGDSWLFESGLGFRYFDMGGRL